MTLGIPPASTTINVSTSSSSTHDDAMIRHSLRTWSDGSLCMSYIYTMPLLDLDMQPTELGLGQTKLGEVARQ